MLAGAGTGKTTVIAAKVAHLVRNERVDPEQILVLAFNKKAQREIVDRLTGELAAVDVETFHAFGRRVVADYEQCQPSVSKMATDDHIMKSTIDKILDELIDSDEASEARSQLPSLSLRAVCVAVRFPHRRRLRGLLAQR